MKWTKEYKREKERRYYQKNRKKVLKKGKAWRKKNPNYYSDYYWKNRKERKEYSRKYRRKVRRAYLLSLREGIVNHGTRVSRRETDTVRIKREMK